MIRNATSLLVECVEQAPRQEVIFAAGSFEVQVNEAVSRFFDSNAHEKARLTLDYIMQGALFACDRAGANPEPFYLVADKIRSLDYENVWYWKKKVSKDPTRRGRSLRVKVNHGVEHCDFSLVVGFAKHSKELELPLKRFDKPDEIIFMPQLGSLEWLGEDQVLLRPQLQSLSPISVRLPTSTDY